MTAYSVPAFGIDSLVICSWFGTVKTENIKISEANKLTLLVGSNNSGKSTFLEALHFLLTGTKPTAFKNSPENTELTVIGTQNGVKFKRTLTQTGKSTTATLLYCVKTCYLAKIDLTEAESKEIISTLKTISEDLMVTAKDQLRSYMNKNNSGSIWVKSGVYSKLKKITSCLICQTFQIFLRYLSPIL